MKVTGSIVFNVSGVDKSIAIESLDDLTKAVAYIRRNSATDLRNEAVRAFFKDAVKITGSPDDRIESTELRETFERWKLTKGVTGTLGRNHLYEVLQNTKGVKVARPSNRIVFVGAKITMIGPKKAPGFLDEGFDDDMI